MSRASRRWTVALGVVVLAILVLALFWDWNWFKRPIESRVSAQTGRTFTIENLDVDLGRHTRISFDEVRFGNPEWARNREMVTWKQADFTIDVWALVTGRVVLPEVHIVQPIVDLEKNAGGANNWQLPERPVDRKPKKSRFGESVPVIEELAVEQGRLVYYDPTQDTDLTFALETTREDGKPGVSVGAEGQYRKLKVDAKARGGSVLSITDEKVPYPFRGSFQVGDTKGSADGTITGLRTLAAVDLKATLEGKTLAELYPIAGLALPETPPYRVAGRLVRDQEWWKFHDFEGHVGDSDLSGDVDVSYAGRVKLVGTFTSDQVDLDDLAGFVGGTPQTGAGESASTEQKQEAKVLDENPRLLPQKPIDLARMNAMDADVRFKGKSFRNKKLPLENIEFHLVLDQGVLKAHPLNFGVAGGDIASKIDLDAREKDMKLGADLQFRRIDLAKLFPENTLFKDGAGPIGGRALIDGRGRSVAQVLGSSNGDFGIAMRGGRVSNLLLEAMGLDAAEVVKFLFKGDRDVRVRCAVADFGVKDGMMEPRAFVLDTTDTNVHIEGRISLKDETLDLKLRPLPKDFSPLTLRSPLKIQGTFKKPGVGVDEEIVLRGGIAAVLGALVNPLTALIPLLETGPGSNADCQRLIDAVEKNAKTKAP
ncbi:MAG TPA: AsmA family protein [Nevskiaceae bacterium]|nr:AsmA family protein [Nevskiaceae bacterium]